MTRLRAATRQLLLLMAWLACGCAWADDGYVLAVVPQFSQRQLFATWSPIVAEISRRTGLKLELVSTLTIDEFERGMSQGAFAFAYANPYQIMRESGRQGYIPLVRDEIPLTGILVVSGDSPVSSPGQLNGKTLAVPSANALGASLLLQADLDQIYHVHLNLLSVKTHSSVYLNVANGLADAGGGVQKTFDEQGAQLRGALRILYRTRAMPSHPLAAHPRVAKPTREAVRDAVLQMSRTDEGRAMLARVPMTRPVAASMDDYAVMRSWGLEKYWVESSE
jgi:phosphonate transport system substrate-binding protein